MSKAITEAAYHAAKAKADAGDTFGAWQVLAGAGDNYARAGARIMDPNGDSFIKAMVGKTWEFSVGLGVYNAKFSTVAAHHLSGYLTIIKESIDKKEGAVLPTTFQIEESYKEALDGSNVSHNASIDAIINSLGGLSPHWARLLDKFDGDWSNIYDINESRIKGEHAIYSSYGPVEAAAALFQIATAALAEQTEGSFPDDEYAGTHPGDNSGDGSPPGTPNTESAVGDFWGKLLSADVQAGVWSNRVGGVVGGILGSHSATNAVQYAIDRRSSITDTPTPADPPASTVGDGVRIPLQPGDLDTGGSGGDGQERVPPGPQVSETTYQNVISGLNAVKPGLGTAVDTFRRAAEWVDRTFFRGRDDGPTGAPAPPGLPGAVGTGDWGDGTRGGDSGSSGKPIVLDLGGDGVELVPLEESTAFYDINGDGYQYNIGWAGKDDGILAYDKNADGKINQRGEISFVDYVDGAKTDLEGLRHFDSNKDGILDSRDAEFGKFRVWQDADQDGISDTGELKTLAQAGIRSINLQYAADDDGESEVLDGNIIFGEGEFVKTDGTRRRYADVMFNTATAGYRWRGDTLEFKTAEGRGKIRVAPNDASAGLNMHFSQAGNADYVGAVGNDHADTLNGGGVTRNLLLEGGAGQDRLTGGSGDDWLAGGGGADTLRGGAGHDVLFFDASDDIHGGGGQDVGVVSGGGSIDLSMGATGLEALHSGGGDDRLSGFDSAQGVIIDGGGGDDTLRGSHQRDVLSGGEGNDYIKGHKGQDVVLGGAGADRLEGNRGDDLLFGGAGDDRLYGLIDDDQLFGGDGADILDGGSGNDRLEGGDGADTLHGGLGDDRLQGGSGNDHLEGNEGQDYLKGQQGDDTLFGGAGDDRLEGNRGDDRVYGGAGNDHLYGLLDNDQLFGGDGNDHLDGGLGDDQLQGGGGSDTYYFTYSDFGSDTIGDSGGSSDVIDLRDRRYEDIWLSRHGDDLRISILGTEDEVLVEGQFAGAGSRIESLWAGRWMQAGDGFITADVKAFEESHLVSIDALVNAMSAFDKPQGDLWEMSNQEFANVEAAWGAVGVGHGANAVMISNAPLTVAA